MLDERHLRCAFCTHHSARRVFIVCITINLTDCSITCTGLGGAYGEPVPEDPVLRPIALKLVRIISCYSRSNLSVPESNVTGTLLMNMQSHNISVYRLDTKVIEAVKMKSARTVPDFYCDLASSEPQKEYLMLASTFWSWSRDGAYDRRWANICECEMGLAAQVSEIGRRNLCVNIWASYILEARLGIKTKPTFPTFSPHQHLSSSFNFSTLLLPQFFRQSFCPFKTTKASTCISQPSPFWPQLSHHPPLPIMLPKLHRSHRWFPAWIRTLHH